MKLITKMFRTIHAPPPTFRLMEAQGKFIVASLNNNFANFNKRIFRNSILRHFMTSQLI